MKSSGGARTFDDEVPPHEMPQNNRETQDMADMARIEEVPDHRDAFVVEDNHHSEDHQDGMDWTS
jgi:hypothetical protein